MTTINKTRRGTENLDAEALILGAGQGSRIGKGPKLFLRLGDASLLQIAVRLVAPYVSAVRVAVPKEALEKAKRQLEDLDTDCDLVCGGKTRQDSLKLLLNRCQASNVIVHEVARPHVSQSLIQQLLREVVRAPAVVPYIEVRTPFLRKDGVDDWLNVPCQEARIPQTPQAFHRETLQRAMEYAELSAKQTASNVELMQESGLSIHYIKGEERNFKITTDFDWFVSQNIWSAP